MFVNGRKSCYITLKDHKSNFLNNLKAYLLNPVKNEFDRTSKTILDKINALRNLVMVNQWKHTIEVVNWFKNIESKQKHKLILLDIKDFYPKMTKDLLTK